MRVGFWLDNKNVRNADLSRPQEGNPGIGASQYLHAAIPYALQRHYPELGRPVLLAPYIEHLPPTLELHRADSVGQAALRAKELGLDFFVFRTRLQEEEGILSVLDELRLPSIGVAHLTPVPVHIRAMARCSHLRAMVCVGRQQYDSLVDSPVHRKLTWIDNCVFLESYPKAAPDKIKGLVIYIGSLVPQKGFHVLAAAWPRVLARAPWARLMVIGSARVYNDQAELGPWGVAKPAYERKFLIPALARADGRPHPSVTFLGRLGIEKNLVMSKALVGVVNPTGSSETSCLAAMEVQACRTAVVSGAYQALLDTVVHGSTGLLGRSPRELADNISALLLDPARAERMGERGYYHVRDRFDFPVVCDKWMRLFSTLADGSELEYEFPRNNLLRHAKLLRIANRPLQLLFGKWMRWPSVQEAMYFLNRLKRKLRPS